MKVGYMVRKYFLAFGLTLATGMAAAGENASNPLASVNNVDLRWKFTSADAGDRHDVFIDASHMLLPKLKLKYEVHYNFTDVTGSNESGFEKLVIKPIYFPVQSKLNDAWGLKVAVGADWIVDFDNADKGIGSGSDQVAPLFGVAFSHFSSGLVLIPLVQHFVSYSGDTDVHQTSARLIPLKPLGQGYWAMPDAKIPCHWANQRLQITAGL